MGLFENFPYANFHELNLDWILHELKELETEITNFVAINSVKYANPIVWDITSQYETNTVVLDSSGNAYLSVQPVPAGVALDREEYWTKIGNFSALWDSVRSAITPYDEQHNTTASVNHKAGDWVWVENDLLLITKDMIAGDKYVDGGNCKKTNVHDLFVTLGDTITNEVNTLSGELQVEITARENADTALDQKITAEAAARAEADTALDQKITNEATARENADTALNQKITDAATSIEENRNIVSLQEFGVTGSGDESEKVQRAFAWAKAHGIGKIVSKTDVQFSGVIIDFSVDIDFYGHIAQGVRIHDQTNRIKTMFTASTSGLNISFRNMKLKGYSDLTDAGVKPDQSSPIEISNAKSVVFDGCTFENHRAGYYSSIADNMALRKGVLYTILDTANTELRNCIISDCKGEELGFIMAVNKPREYVNGCMKNCEYLAPINTSTIDFIGNTFVFENNTYSYDYPGSITNCFALHLIATGDTLKGNCGGAFYDNCEEQVWQGDTIDISNVRVTGTCNTLCQSASNVCYIHDIHDTANIDLICIARYGIGVANPNNFQYAATTDLVNPQVIISNIKTTGECTIYNEGGKSVGYSLMLDNCDLHNRKKMVVAQNTEMVAVRNTKIKNAIDTDFSSLTGISMNFFYSCPNVIRFDNCNFENLDRAKEEYVTAGTNANTKIFVSNCYSDTTNETGNVVSNAGTFKTANNIGIKEANAQA